MIPEKITVTGVDYDRIKQHSTNADFIELPFILAGRPDDTWKGICVKEYSATQPQSRRRMFITENLIIIVAHIDDDLAEHKETIEHAVSQANRRYAELARQEEQGRDELRQNQEKLAAFKKRAAQLFE